MWLEVVYAVRSLGRSPKFAFAATLILAWVSVQQRPYLVSSTTPYFARFRLTTVDSCK